MERDEVLKVVDEINAVLQSHGWMDFEVMEYGNYRLHLQGGIDRTVAHDVDIYFEGVFHLSLPMEWQTDTSAPSLKLLGGQEAYAENIKFKVEQGHYVFRFTPEDYPNNFGCYISAKHVSYSIPTDARRAS